MALEQRDEHKVAVECDGKKKCSKRERGGENERAKLGFLRLQALERDAVAR